MKKILFSTLALVAVAFGFVSCGDDDDNTRTDASYPVTGTYVSTDFIPDESSYPLTAEEGSLTITVTKVDTENTQADKVEISGKVVNSSTKAERTVSGSYVMNASKYNDSYLLVAGKNSTLIGCRVVGDELRCHLKLTPAGKITAVGKFYTIVAKKQILE